MSFFSSTKVALARLRRTTDDGLRAAVIAVFVMSAGAPVLSADEVAKKSFRYDAHGRRDPFRPLVQDGRVVGVSGRSPSAAETDRPVLYGILWDPGGKSIALINDLEVKVGDTVNGYRVAEIRQDAVVITNGGEPVVLQIAFEMSPSGTTTGGEPR